MTKDSLGDRMKSYYEGISKSSLMRRTPVIIRIDGRAFHTFTRGFQKPYDEVLARAMNMTTKALCSSIQGCVFGHEQLGSESWSNQLWTCRSGYGYLSFNASNTCMYAQP